MSPDLLGGVTATVQRDTLDMQIYSALRQAILNGDLSGGERLVQEEIAQRMNTSRIPVRDALKRLVADGLVTVDERGRHYVASFGLEDVGEVYGLRALLEPHAIDLATEALTEQDLHELEDLVSAMEAAARSKDADRFVELNQLFHLSLYEPSGQRRLLRMIEGLWSGMPPRTPIAIPGQMAASAREHRALLEAVRRRDPKTAAQLLRDHINRTRTTFERHMLAKGSS